VKKKLWIACMMITIVNFVYMLFLTKWSNVTVFVLAYADCLVDALDYSMSKLWGATCLKLRWICNYSHFLASISSDRLLSIISSKYLTFLTIGMSLLVSDSIAWKNQTVFPCSVDSLVMMWTNGYITWKVMQGKHNPRKALAVIGVCDR